MRMVNVLLVEGDASLLPFVQEVAGRMESFEEDWDGNDSMDVSVWTDDETGDVHFTVYPVMDGHTDTLVELARGVIV